MTEEIIQKLKEAVVMGDEDSAAKLAKRALEEGVDPVIALREGLEEGMKELAEKFEEGEVYLPEVMIGADAFERGEEVLSSAISENKRREFKGKVVIGTVYGDIHDIGKSLVATLLKINGFDVIDLGSDVETKKFVSTCKEVGSNIVALSCLLSSSVPFMSDVRDWLKNEGMRENTYLIVGGGTVNPDRAMDIGADGYGRYAEDAVRLCEELVREKPNPPLDKPIVKGE